MIMKNNAGTHQFTPSGIIHTYDGAVLDQGMLHQNAFYFPWRNVISSRNNHVVIAIDEPEIPFFILHENVTGHIPTIAYKVFLAFQVTQVTTPGRPANCDPPLDILRQWLAVFVNQPDGIAWHHFSC